MELLITGHQGFIGSNLCQYFKNKWSPNLPKNDEDKIRRLVLKHLNKLNDKKFTIITKV